MSDGPILHHLNFIQNIFGTSRLSGIINIAIILFISVVLLIFIVLPIARLVLDALDFRRLRDRNKVFLEITPPASSTKTSYATAQWLGAIKGLLVSQSYKSRFLHHKKVLPLEVVSTRSGGIRFIAQLDPRDVGIFKQLFVSYLPTAQFKEVEDYIPYLSTQEEIRIMAFKQAGHFAYPLAAQETLIQHDPIAFITGAMTKPLPGETIALQLILSPASPRVAGQIRSKLIHGHDAGLQRRWWYFPFIVVGRIFKLCLALLGSLLEIISEGISGIRDTRPKSSYVPPAITPVTNHVIDSVHAKLAQPLFNVDIRAIVIGPDSKQRMQGLANSLYQFHVPGYQGLTSRSNFPSGWRFKQRLEAYRDRLPSMFTANSSVFSASEVAGLYHFPYGATTQTENTVRSLSKTLSAPLAMKQHADANDFDVVLGVNHYHGSDTMVGLSAANRERHVYVIGGTGNGKTTLLQYAITQDMVAGKGLAFIDPHGDAARKLLGYVPESRLHDVIYLNPIDIKYPIGINLLELPAGLDADDLLIEKERVAEAVVSVLRKVFADDDANAHRIEALLRNAIWTAFTVPDATLFTILKLLRNSAFRKSVVDRLDDEDLKDFWHEEFGQAGGMQRVSMSKGLTHRIDRFRSSAPAYRMFGQAKSTISFEDIMNKGKVLICNFSTEMGEDTSTLFGTAVLAKLKIAAERRATMLEEQRHPFYVYVDEFQNFATTPFVKMLSASRKYKLYLTIAEQSTAQQEEQRLTEAILANVSTVICFNTGSPADEKLLLPRFEPYIERNDIGNLPAYHYYLKVKGTEPMEPVSAETLLLENEGSQTIAQTVIENSRQNYAIRYVAPVTAPIKPVRGPASLQNKQSVRRNGVAKKALRHKSAKVLDVNISKSQQSA